VTPQGPPYADPPHLTWSYDSFCWFYEQFTLPDGQPARLEGFQRLILRDIFEPDDGLRLWTAAGARENDRRELLVLIPKGQAKTTLMAALAVFHLLIVPNANCYIGAADKIQAGEMYRFASHFVESEPEIAALAKVLGGTKRIESRTDQGFIQVLASDDSKEGGKKQGFNPTLALLDELHAHENDNLYTDMRSGLFKRNGILVTITTAGWNLEGVLGKLRQTFLDAAVTGGQVFKNLIATDDGGTRVDNALGRLTRAVKRSGNSVMLEWALRPQSKKPGEDAGDDPTDMRVVKLVNPASWVTIASLVDALESLRFGAFKRYRCNLWTLAFDAWIPDGKWDELYNPSVPEVEHRTWLDAPEEELEAYIKTLYPPDTPVVGFIDMARYRDCAAILLLGRIDGLCVPRAIVWKSGGEDHPIPYGPTKFAWRRIADNYRLGAAAYDPKYYDQSAEELTDGEDGEKPIDVMELWPQSNERMCPAAADLRTAILTDKKFAHDGDPILSAHIMSAVSQEVGKDMFKLVKSGPNGPPIDACVSLAVANALDGLDGRSMYEDGDASV
jgi:hypothetical protein